MNNKKKTLCLYIKNGRKIELYIFNFKFLVFLVGKMHDRAKQDQKQDQAK